jgi:hypothetical protein
MENTGTGCGIFGSGVSASGVVGYSTSNSGVHGQSQSGTGIQANSVSGTGIQATGTPAGQFFGDVNITGNLTVDGANILQAITQIAGQLSQLQAEVAGIISKL